MSTEHPPYRDELAAYALGALEPAEVETLERHVADCAECREYLFWLDPAVDLLQASVEQREAPKRRKRALMAEVNADLRRLTGPSANVSARIAACGERSGDP